jgi:hypothetical protein
MDDVAVGVERLAAESANSMRRIVKAISAEVTDCPRLFTLSVGERTGLDRLRVGETPLQLVLWCEHPSGYHPWPPATYDVREPKEWLLTVAPYLTLVFKTLRLVVPITASVAGIVLSQDQFEASSRYLDQMKTLVDKLPQQIGEDWKDPEPLQSGPLGPAEGQALRAVRMLVFKLDPARAFGDLRRVQVPSGEFLWVCPRHYSEYDPGLPEIP